MSTTERPTLLRPVGKTTPWPTYPPDPTGDAIMRQWERAEAAREEERRFRVAYHEATEDIDNLADEGMAHEAAYAALEERERFVAGWAGIATTIAVVLLLILVLQFAVK